MAKASRKISACEHPWILELDDYEISNLYHALEIILSADYNVEARWLNSGDWTGQIRNAIHILNGLLNEPNGVYGVDYGK